MAAAVEWNPKKVLERQSDRSQIGTGLDGTGQLRFYFLSKERIQIVVAELRRIFPVDGRDFVTGLEAQSRGRAIEGVADDFPLQSCGGNCRSRKTMRVAFAVGDGALAVTCVHDFNAWIKDTRHDGLMTLQSKFGSPATPDRIGGRPLDGSVFALCPSRYDL